MSTTGGYNGAMTTLHAMKYVHELEMLSQMIFPIKCSGFQAFLLTSAVIVRCKMFLARIERVAIYALALSRR